MPRHLQILWISIFALIFVMFLSPGRSKADDDFKATYDLGISIGKQTGGTGTSPSGALTDHDYTEADLGLNLFFKPWIDWRNAIFARFVSEADDFYGLDTSVRGVLDIAGSPMGLHTFAGPGYRFVTKGEDLPFAEAGVVFVFPGFSFGGGVKGFFNEWVDSNAKNETQFFIILAGNGQL